MAGTAKLARNDVGTTRSCRQNLATLSPTGTCRPTCRQHAQLSQRSVAQDGYLFVARATKSYLDPFTRFLQAQVLTVVRAFRLVVLHTLVFQLCRHHHLGEARGKIICNSKSALRKSSRRCRRIRPGSAQGDIFLTLHAIHHEEMQGTSLTYE